MPEQMNFINIKPKNAKEKADFQKIEAAVTAVYQKLQNLDFAKTGLSEYNQRYLKEYLDNFTFFARFYTQVLVEALRVLNKPVKNATFVDYGGGSGFFSLLAKELGFGTVVYNDIYNVSVDDAKLLAKATGIKTDFFIEGDIDILVSELNAKNIRPDLICSFEVIEHIYKLEDWFKTAAKLNSSFSLVFSSSANSRNPYITRRLKKGQIKAEIEGSAKKWGSKKRDTVLPFLQVREEMISEKFPGLGEEIIHKLAIATRGMKKEDIFRAVEIFGETGEVIKPLPHPTNTCDPYTGNWSEHLIDFKWLKQIMAENGFSDISIKPGLYTWSDNKIVYAFKKFLNVFIRFYGKKGLILSPIYILKARKISDFKP